MTDWWRFFTGGPLPLYVALRLNCSAPRVSCCEVQWDRPAARPLLFPQLHSLLSPGRRVTSQERLVTTQCAKQKRGALWFKLRNVVYVYHKKNISGWDVCYDHRRKLRARFIDLILTSHILSLKWIKKILYWSEFNPFSLSSAIQMQSIYHWKIVFCLWACQEWKALALCLSVTRPDFLFFCFFFFLFFFFLLRQHLFSRYISPFISYFNCRLTWLVNIWSVNEKTISLLDWTDGDLAFGFARQGKFQNTTSLII